MKSSNLKKAVLRVVSFVVIASFMFSNVSFAFTPDTLRTEGPKITGAREQIAAEVRAGGVEITQSIRITEEQTTANRLNPKLLDGLKLDDGSVIRVLSEKEDFPPEVLSHWDNHYAVFEITNENLGYTAYMAIHRLTKIVSKAEVVNGQWRATGGTRIRNYKDNNAALADALELAMEMSFKNAGAKLPIGGSKCTINVKIDPRSNGQGGEARYNILVSYAKAIERIGNLIGGGVLTGQDINIGVADARLLFEHAPTSVVPYIDEGRSIPPTPPTGIGVFAAMKAAVEKTFPTRPTFDGKVVAVQGVGGTGELLLMPLLMGGAKVIASDVDAEKVESLKVKYSAFISTGQLFIFTEDKLPGGGYTSKIMNPLSEFPEQISSLTGIDHIDVFSPCAVGPVLNPSAIDTLKKAGVKIVCGSANNVSEDKTRDPQLLKEAGILYIPDYIANAGGVTGVDGHLGHDVTDSGIAKRIYARVIELIKTAEAEGKTLQETADRTSRAFFEKLPKAEKASATALASTGKPTAPGSPAGLLSLLLKVDPALAVTESYIAQNVGERTLKVSTIKPDITAFKQWGLIETIYEGGHTYRLTKAARERGPELLALLGTLPARPTKAQRDAIASQIATILAQGGKAAGDGSQITAQPKLDADTVEKLKTLSNYLRRDILEMLFNPGSGHPGGSLSAAEIFSTLYFSGILNNDPNDPEWENRDRVVLSKGHAAPVLYAALGEAGYFSKEEFKNLRKDPTAMLQGHPDKKKTPGVDWSTGALGQGFSAACGMAAAARLLGKTSHIWTVIGGGEEQEGQISEAARHAVAIGITNITAIIDDNGYQIEGKGEDVDKADVAKLWEGYGWNVIKVDGHNVSALYNAMEQAKNIKDKPTLIIAKTQKGKGVKYFEDRPTESHGSVPKDEAVRAEALKEVNAAIVAGTPFNGIDGFIRARQLTAAEKARIDEENKPKPVAAENRIVALKELKLGDKMATRARFGEMITYLGSTNQNVVAMSADLQGSANLNEFEKLFGLMSPENPRGRYVALGIRESHGPDFAAGMADMGIIPFVHTFDIFSLNMLPQIRAIIQMGVPVVFAFTHSGVGTGEDGASHQGIESPGVMDILSGPLGDMMDVYEPSDAGEVGVILTSLFKDGGPKKPVFIRLTRQDVPILDRSKVENYEQRVAEGSYVLRDPGNGKNNLIITASGATVAEAVKVSEELEKMGIKVKVINVVSLNKIDNPDNPFSTYLEDNVPIITVCDALAKVLQNPVLRAADLIRKQGRNPGPVYPLGVSILGSGTPQLLYQLNGLDAAGIKKSALGIVSPALPPAPVKPIEVPKVTIPAQGHLAELTKLGTRYYLDSVHPVLIDREIPNGAVGATSNPIIINDIVAEVLKNIEINGGPSNEFEEKINSVLQAETDKEKATWEITKVIIAYTAAKFSHIYENTNADAGYVSVEVDPRIEDSKAGPYKSMDKEQRIAEVIRQAVELQEIAPNVMVKVPATEIGLAALEALAYQGINLNVTLIFDRGQAGIARENVERGLKRRADEADGAITGLAAAAKRVKTVYSVFVSRTDDYTSKAAPQLGLAQGELGTYVAKLIYLDNKGFWEGKGYPLKHEVIFASTGSKHPSVSGLKTEKDVDSAAPELQVAMGKYVYDLAGDDIQTNPPLTAYSVNRAPKTVERTVDRLPPDDVKEVMDKYLAENSGELHRVLMKQAIEKFVTPQVTLVSNIEVSIAKIREPQIKLALQKITSSISTANSVLKIQDARETVLGSFGLTPETLKDGSLAYVFSTSAVFDENGLGVLIAALANRGLQIAVVAKEGNAAQKKVIDQINSAISEEKNKVVTYGSLGEAVRELKDNNGATNIAYVATSEEKKEAELLGLNIDSVLLINNILKSLKGIATLQQTLEDFKSACEVIGTQV